MQVSHTFDSKKMLGIQSQRSKVLREISCTKCGAAELTEEVPQSSKMAVIFCNALLYIALYTYNALKYCGKEGSQSSW